MTSRRRAVRAAALAAALVVALVVALVTVVRVVGLVRPGPDVRLLRTGPVSVRVCREILGLRPRCADLPGRAGEVARQVEAVRWRPRAGTRSVPGRELGITERFVLGSASGPPVEVVLSGESTPVATSGGFVAEDDDPAVRALAALAARLVPL